MSPGVCATLFASEPDVISLTNLDIDHSGRVWVCEVANDTLQFLQRKQDRSTNGVPFLDGGIRETCPSFLFHLAGERLYRGVH